MWTTPTSTGAPNYAPAKGCTSRQPEPDLPDPRPARCCTNATLTGLAATGRGVHAWVSRGLPRPAGSHQPGHTSQVTPAGSLLDHGDQDLHGRTDVPRGVDRAVLDPVRAVAGLTLLEWRQGQPASPQVPVDEVVDVRARGGEQERLVRVCRPAVEVVPAVTVEAELGDDVPILIVLGQQIHGERLAERVVGWLAGLLDDVQRLGQDGLDGGRCVVDGPGHLVGGAASGPRVAHFGAYLVGALGELQLIEVQGAVIGSIRQLFAIEPPGDVERTVNGMGGVDRQRRLPADR